MLPAASYYERGLRHYCIAFNCIDEKPGRSGQELQQQR